MPTRVKIIPKCKRAENRVKEHGEVMRLMEKHPAYGILVQSIKETWGSAGRKENWMGWFKDTEADFEVVE